MMEELRASRPAPKQSFLAVLERAATGLLEPRDSLASLQCVLLQCVAGRSNKLARAMAGRGAWADATSPRGLSKVPRPSPASLSPSPRSGPALPGACW